MQNLYVLMEAKKNSLKRHILNILTTSRWIGSLCSFKARLFVNHLALWPYRWQIRRKLFLWFYKVKLLISFRNVCYPTKWLHNLDWKFDVLLFRTAYIVHLYCMVHTIFFLSPLFLLCNCLLRFESCTIQCNHISSPLLRFYDDEVMEKFRSEQTLKYHTINIFSCLYLLQP